MTLRSVAIPGLFLAAILAASEASALVKVRCSAWRGETIVVRTRDYDIVRTPPPGITLRAGRVESVRFQTDALWSPDLESASFASPAAMGEIVFE